ncbi:MAG TPA: hypothetical protein DGB85_12895 [Deltaproteobacteria bacterium]|nr:hypothetical protein [Deltaproteobacteria bacterium]
MQILHGRFPEAPIGVVGFSIGGIILLNWLGQNESVSIQAACASPFTTIYPPALINSIKVFQKSISNIWWVG